MDEKLDLNTLCIVCGSENTVEEADIDWMDMYLDGEEVPLYCADCEMFTTIVTFSEPVVNSKKHYNRD